MSRRAGAVSYTHLIVELVELCCKLDNIARDAYRVVVLCGADDLIGVRRDVLDELKLLRRGEQCELLCGACLLYTS